MRRTPPGPAHTIGATRIAPRGLSARGGLALPFDEFRQRVDRSKSRTRHVFIGDRDVELLFDENDELQRVDGIETQSLAEDCVGIDDGLLKKNMKEKTEDEVIEMLNGCVCCTVREAS